MCKPCVWLGDPLPSICSSCFMSLLWRSIKQFCTVGYTVLTMHVGCYQLSGFLSSTMHHCLHKVACFGPNLMVFGCSTYDKPLITFWAFSCYVWYHLYGTPPPTPRSFLLPAWAPLPQGALGITAPSPPPLPTYHTLSPPPLYRLYYSGNWQCIPYSFIFLLYGMGLVVRHCGRYIVIRVGLILAPYLECLLEQV